MSFRNRFIGAFALLLLGGLPATAQMGDEPEGASPSGASPFPAGTAAPARAAADRDAGAQQDYWGFGFGYVFNRIPISMSTFNVGISDLWYSHIFGNPAEKTRIAGTLGFYGFQILLPVPKASVDLYFGKPSDAIQFKGGVGGFYDVAIGGHGGLMGELGVVLKNRVDISFLAVPLGSDSERSYSEFIGTETKQEADLHRANGGKFVELPYYGVKMGLRF
jgi:hypothetical protein